jgi:hypothetical protein
VKVEIHTGRSLGRGQRGHALCDSLGIGTDRKLGRGHTTVDSNRFGADCQGRNSESE